MDRNDDIIELGAASVETKGPAGVGHDESLKIRPLGLSAD